jgi:hypothetical protein
MKKIIVIILVVLLFLISKEEIQEWTFYVMTVSDFTDRCKENTQCIESIEAQAENCLDKAKWQDYMSDTENEAKKKYFAKTLTACFVDAEGKPYFTS